VGRDVNLGVRIGVGLGVLIASGCCGCDTCIFFYEEERQRGAGSDDADDGRMEGGMERAGDNTVLD
jgi:hypothetical protein